MKSFYLFLVSILFVSYSTAPKEYPVNNTICYYADPIFDISKEELILNPNVLKHPRDSNGDIILVDNKRYRNTYYIFSNKNVMNYQINKQIGVGKCIVYRENRTIKSIEFKYLNGTQSIFKEIYYNEQGEITEVIDYEKGYTICWAEAIEIVKEVAKTDIKKYEVTKFNLLFRANLNKFPNKRPKWGISLIVNDGYKLKDIKVYWIDGITGEFLTTTEVTMIP